MPTERKVYQGRPCKHGHIGLRYRTSRQCIDCSKKYAKIAGNRNAVKFQKKHRERLNAEARERRILDPTKHRKAILKNRLANPERVKEHWRKSRVARKYKIKQSEKNYSEADRLLIFKLQNGCCFYCDAPLTYGSEHGDHYIALSRGGSDARYNIVIACATRNLRKSAESPVVFALRKGFDLSRRPVFWSEEAQNAG